MKIFPIILLALFFSCTSVSQKKNNTPKNSIVYKVPKNSIPIQYQDGRIITTGKVQGKSNARFILDNGSWFLSLDSTYISKNKNLGINVNDKICVDLKTPDGLFSCPTSSEEVIVHISNHKYKFGAAIIEDIRRYYYVDSIQGNFPLHEMYTKRFLDINIFRNYIRSIDSMNLDGYIKVPFKKHNTNAYLVESNFTFSVNGKEYNKQGVIILDYGNPSSSFFVNKVIIEDVDESFIDRCQSINKQKPYYNVIKCDYFNFNIPIKTSLKNMELTLLDNDPFLNSDGPLCNIGVEFLKNFHIVIDDKENFLYVKAYAKTYAIRGKKNWKEWGINILPYFDEKEKGSHTWLICSMNLNKKATKLGVYVGDTIVQIDKFNTSKLSISKGIRLLKNASELHIKGKKGITILK